MQTKTGAYFSGASAITFPFLMNVVPCQSMESWRSLFESRSEADMEENTANSFFAFSLTWALLGLL